MSDMPAETPQPKKSKPWTLMFFFASDNSLSPSTLPQLKAIKAAGRSDNANVLVYFDPNERGAPTRVFSINEDPASTIASTDASGDPVISVLSSDYLRPDDIQTRGPESKAFVDSLRPPNDKLKADTALEQFLGFCRETYPAEHYMLFLVGHGLVVGRDAFLPDDNPSTAIGLTRLGEILKSFKSKIGNGKLDLIGMHSCSMSGVEIAYELQDTATYMLASQGISFVGSWPYRQLLTKIYKDIALQDPDIPTLVRRLHSLCIQYSVDFMHAGYSSDMCLCCLEEERVTALTTPISNLSQALQAGIEIPRCRDLIVLAHWRSQSYWQETYTDLCDFCLCLKRLCRDPFRDPTGEGRGTFEEDVKRIAIIQACDEVIDILKPENGRGPIVCTDYVGPDLQYSHGLSIYFPWSDPVEDENDKIIDQYGTYAFTTAQQSWFEFLKLYFDKTKRPDRMDEEKRADASSTYAQPDYQTFINNLSQSFPSGTATSTRDFFPMSVLEGKVSPPDSTGGACSCASTKNYSRIFSMSPGAATMLGNTQLTATSATGSPAQANPTGGPSQRGGPPQSAT